MPPTHLARSGRGYAIEGRAASTVDSAYSVVRVWDGLYEAEKRHNGRGKNAKDAFCLHCVTPLYIDKLVSFPAFRYLGYPFVSHASRNSACGKKERAYSRHDEQ